MFKSVLSLIKVESENKPAVDQAATGGPVKLEVAVVGSWDRGSVHCEGFVSGLGRGKLDKTVASIAARVSTTSSKLRGQLRDVMSSGIFSKSTRPLEPCQGRIKSSGNCS